MRNELLLCVLLLTATASEAAESATGNAERNPVAVFRGLLAMRTDARATELSTQPERLRAVLTTRLRDYDALPAVEREGRLRATELRYFLNPLLMTLPATRATQLATVPESYRSLVEERLAAWDKLPAEIQREILLDERLRQAMTRPAVVGAFPRCLRVWSRRCRRISRSGRPLTCGSASSCSTTSPTTSGSTSARRHGSSPRCRSQPARRLRSRWASSKTSRRGARRLRLCTQAVGPDDSGAANAVLRQRGKVEADAGVRARPMEESCH